MPLGRIASETMARPGLQRVQLWRGIAVPFFLIVFSAVFVAIAELHGNARVRAALGALIFCCVAAMAVVIHRLVLLPAGQSHANASGRGWRRMGKALFAMLAIWAAFVVTGLAVGFGLYGMFRAGNLWLPPFWIQTLGAAAAAWVLARLCLVTPGLVLDQHNALMTAWQVSRGNGWRLAALLVVVPWLFMLYVQLMWPQGVDRIIFVLVIVMSAIVAIFELFAISLSYRELIRYAPPPTPPPD